MSKTLTTHYLKQLFNHETSVKSFKQEEKTPMYLLVPLTWQQDVLSSGISKILILWSENQEAPVFYGSADHTEVWKDYFY